MAWASFLDDGVNESTGLTRDTRSGPCEVAARSVRPVAGNGEGASSRWLAAIADPAGADGQPVDTLPPMRFPDPATPFARALAAPLLALSLVACASDDAPSVVPTTPRSTPDTTTATTATINSALPTTDPPVTTPASTSPPEPTASETAVATAPTGPDDGVVRVMVAVSDGSVTTDDDRVGIPLGDAVELTVVADVADEVHVHGYDLFGHVAPEAPAIVAFTADIPGLFEVELEGVGLLLVELQVS
jgi:hypothetical protein